MPTLYVRTATEQVADFLREQIRSGTWSDTMPGGATLAKELGVGRMTVDAALDLLEKKGDLVSQGARLPRRISPKIDFSSSLKVAFLPYLIEDYRFDYIMDMQRLLQQEGHNLILAEKSITQMKGNLTKISNLAERTQADAWIIIAGTKEVLKWFVDNNIPAFALFGRRSEVALPAIGPDRKPALRAMLRHFIGLGHERIALLTRPLRRLPTPGDSERAFLEELENAGIRTGRFNLPDWDGETKSLGRLIDSMFSVTPPTAILIDEPPIFFSVQQRLAQNGILAPRHVSLACTDWDPYFEFQEPSIAYFIWDHRPWVRRVVQWVRNVSQGKADKRQSKTVTRFVLGDSIGPVPRT